MSGVAARVAAGVAYLDEREPGWWQRIDLNRLVMSAECRCVLGQLATDLEVYGWKEIVREFGLRQAPCSPAHGSQLTDWGLGFNARLDQHADEQNREYAELEAAWKRVITERRAAS
jgi:hypothetical protein